MRPKIKHLQEQLAHADKASEERVDLLHALAWESWSNDPTEAELLTQEAFDLAQQLQYERGLAYSSFYQGIAQGLRKEDTEKAMTCFWEALEWFEAHEDRQGQAQVMSMLGNVYWGFGDFERGFEFSTRALQIYKEIEEVEGTAWTLSSLGRFYYDAGDHERALDYYQQACQLFAQADEPMGRARNMNGIGTVFHLLGKHEEGFEYQMQSLALHQSIGDKMGESRTLNDIGLMFQSLGDDDTALSYHHQSLKLRRELGYNTGEATSLLDLGNVYFHLGQYDRALEVLNRALQLSGQMKAVPKTGRAHRALAQVYKAMGQFEQALYHHEQYADAEIEMFQEDAGKNAQSLQTAYQVEASKQEAEIYRLKNVELKDKNDQLEQTLKKLNATQAQLIQSGKVRALGRLVAGVTHELNTPLGVVKSAMDVSHRGVTRMAEILTADGICASVPEDHELRRTIRLLEKNMHGHLQATDRLSAIINSLKNFIRLDEADFQKADIHEGLENTLTLLEYEFKDRITVTRNYGALPEIYCHPGQLNQVFMNLLINAAQSVTDKGQITVTTTTDDSKITLTIVDTGKGIPPEQLEHLFEPGFITTGSRVRMRTGLYTSYTIIQEHQGNLYATSEAGKGSTFHIVLPIDGER